MNKKIALISAGVLAALLLIIIIIFELNDKPDKKVTNVTSSLMETTTEKETTTEYIFGEQDRDLVFDVYVKDEKDEDDYIESIEEITTHYGITQGKEYDFSNGFIVQPTDHITGLSDGLTDIVECIGTTGANIHIREHNSLETSIQTLRYETIEGLGFSYYLYLDGDGVPMNAEYEIGVGLKGWEDYALPKPYTDPTIVGTEQLICDDIVKTAFGNAMYIEVYNTISKTYDAYAFILCDRDRIIEIHISDEKQETLYDYVVELTNDGIVLIK